MSYIRHKILLTLALTAPTLPIEQGFAGDSWEPPAASTSWPTAPRAALHMLFLHAVEVSIRPARAAA
ncbi:hypothetical protein PT2222_300127 [Paraburkholderia tropica]